MAIAGCARKWKPDQTARPTTQSIAIDHGTVGLHRKLEVEGEVWYQLQGATLLVLDHRGEEINSLSLAELGTSESATDLLVHDGQLAVLLGQRHLVLLDVESPWRPVVIDHLEVESLGIWPTGLDVLDGEIVLVGDVDVVTLAGMRKLRSHTGPVSDVAEHGGHVLYVSGRRLYRRAGDDYVGTASLLEPIQPWRDVPKDAIFFARNERTGALVGLLGSDGREFDPDKWTRGVPSSVKALRQRGGHLMVVCEDRLEVFLMTSGGLVPRWSWPIVQLQDADWVNDDTVAFTAAGGRGVVEIGAYSGMDAADVWIPLPGGFAEATSTGEAIVARGPSGSWRYVPGMPPTQMDEAAASEVQMVPPSLHGAVLGWSVEILEDGHATLTGPDGTQQLSPPDQGAFLCVAATEDAFWLGHDSGIMLIMLPDAGSRKQGITRLGVLVDGPVRCIEPLLLGRGVAFAAAGGFGVIREVW